MMTKLDNIKSKILNNRWKKFYQKNELPEISLDDIGISYKNFTPIFTEEICIPPYHGDESLKDYSVLFSVIDYYQPQVILELGTAYGTTVANICSFMDTQVFTVNALPEQISGRGTTYTLTREEIGKVYKTHGFSQRIVQIFEDTKRMSLKNVIPEKSVDFAIVDACHDSDYVLNDFLKIQPVLVHNSVVVLHDTHPSMEKHYLDSYVACMYLRKLGYNIKYIRNTSWAIWLGSDGLLLNNLTKKVLSKISAFFDRMIFGTYENDLIRICRQAKRSLKNRS